MADFLKIQKAASKAFQKQDFLISCGYAIILCQKARDGDVAAWRWHRCFDSTDRFVIFEVRALTCQRSNE
jgi:hypothetical protein